VAEAKAAISPLTAEVLTASGYPPTAAAYTTDGLLKAILQHHLPAT